MYRAHNPEAPGMHNMPSGSSSVTRVTYRRDPGYFERVGGSFCGMLIGFFIFMGGFPVLFWNEGRAVQTARSLDEGLQAVNPLASSDIVIDSYNNKLVHVTGHLKTDMSLTDPEYDINLHVIKLRRDVEMYQWVEHESKREFKEGDRTRVETTYSYSKEWSSKAITSSRFENPFQHENPGSIPVSSYSKTADPVYMGQFRLSKGLVDRVGNYQKFYPVSVPKQHADVRLLDGYFYHSADPQRPQVGDVRVSFHFAGVTDSEHEEKVGDPTKVSIVARQNGAFLSSYQTTAGDKLELLYLGELSAKEIFDAEHTANTMVTWLLRFLGWLIIFIGLQMITDPVRQLVSFLPIVRELVGLATGLLSFTLASSLALVTIAIGWIFYRPLLGIALLAGAAVPIYFSRQKAKKDQDGNTKKDFF